MCTTRRRLSESVERADLSGYSEKNLNDAVDASSALLDERLLSNDFPFTAQRIFGMCQVRLAPAKSSD